MGRQRAVGGLCSPRALRPHLGLGVVTRLPSAKTRTLLAGQRSALPFGHPARAASPPAHWHQEAAGEDTSHKIHGNMEMRDSASSARTSGTEICDSHFPINLHVSLPLAEMNISEINY